ncbi:MAG: hypothetical protein R6U98_02700 [Pirellulaceae bacterium]
MELVPVFDFKTKEISRIPAAELSSHMIQADVDGVGRVWVDARHLRKNTRIHGPLSESLREHIREIKSALDEVYRLSVDEWEDGFRRDENPRRHIAIWLRISRAYKLFTSRKELSSAELSECLDIMVALAYSPRERVLDTVELSALGREQAIEAMDVFDSLPTGQAPGT